MERHVYVIVNQMNSKWLNQDRDTIMAETVVHILKGL